MTPVQTLLQHLAVGPFLLMLLYVFILGFFFAKVEIQIEGSDGWATSLPTWRIEQHLLLTLFWGGRAMTGYHAWVFTFIALIFHMPLVMMGQMSWVLEGRVLAALMLFWVIEDFLWFVLNPGFGLARFNAANATWHKNWVLGAPVEYWVASLLGVLMMGYSYCG
jgi:hypothetical protein